MLHLDFETRSHVNLPKCGAYIYATDPSTEILCMSCAFGDEEPITWEPRQPFPERVAEWFAKGDRRSIAAHNSQFDRLIAWYVLCPEFDIPEPPLEAWYCTAAQARSRAYPGALADLGLCLGLETQKDRRGEALIKLMSIPPYEWSEALLAEMVEYCRRDVIVERAAAARTAPLTEAEFTQFLVSEAINERGLRVDVELARAATTYAEAETKEISALLSEITDGVVTTPRQFARAKKWFKEHAPKRATKLMLRVKTDRRTRKETRKESLDKAVRHNILSLEAAHPGLLTADAADFLELVDEAGRTSVSKFRKMVSMADPEDNRVRGAYLFAGAGQTGRFSSKGLQVHNFSRNSAKDPETTRREIMETRLRGPVLDGLASMLRPAILAAPGHVFVCGDWSSIEGRVLPWLSNNSLADARLQAYADGRGIYEETAASFGGSRQEGKVAELSLGFGGGVGAFVSMARNYNVKVTEERAAKIRDAWREDNPWATAFWADLEMAVVHAAVYGSRSHRLGWPLEGVTAGRVTYGFLFERTEMVEARVRYGWDIKPELRAMVYGTLLCQLPSGRELTYPQFSCPVPASAWEAAHTGWIDVKGGTPIYSAIKGAWKPARGDSEWPRFDLWYGLLAENVTQATAADVLRETLVRVHDRCPGAIAGHTHDEILLEVPVAQKDTALEVLEQEMLRIPPWAAGLPLAAKFWTGTRYRK